MEKKVKRHNAVVGMTAVLEEKIRVDNRRLAGFEDAEKRRGA